MAIFCNSPFSIHHKKPFQRLLFLFFLFVSTVIQSDDLVPTTVVDTVDAQLSELDRASATEADVIRARTWLNKKATAVRVISVNGDVLLVTSVDEPAIALTNGMFVEMDAEVQTGINSGARFELDDGSKVYLNASSLLRFKRLYR